MNIAWLVWPAALPETNGLKYTENYSRLTGIWERFINYDSCGCKESGRSNGGSSG